MIGKLMFSKVSRSSFIAAAIATGLVGAQPALAAHILPARAGSPQFLSDAGCWSAYGPTMTNNCGTTKLWYVPLMDAAGTLVDVTAQGNVSCFVYGWDKNGLYFFGSSASLPPGATDIVMPLVVPGLGTGELDCNVSPGSKVITVIW